MVNKTINIEKDFSQFPSGRFFSDGPYSGEAFREKYLVPALKEADTVTVQIDGTRGYGSSFLEEAFGGLIRENGFSGNEIKEKLTIETKSIGFEIFKEAIWEYIEDAKEIV